MIVHRPQLYEVCTAPELWAPPDSSRLDGVPCLLTNESHLLLLNGGRKQSVENHAKTPKHRIVGAFRRPRPEKARTCQPCSGRSCSRIILLYALLDHANTLREKTRLLLRFGEECPPTEHPAMSPLVRLSTHHESLAFGMIDVLSTCLRRRGTPRSQQY